MRVHGEVVDMYYGLPIEERLPPPPLTEIAPSMEIQSQPQHDQGPPPHFSFGEHHIAHEETQPEKQDIASVPLLTFEEPSPENAQVQRHGFFTDLPAGSETTGALPSITAVSQSSPPAALPGSDAFDIALPASGAAQAEAEVPPPPVVQVAQPTEAQSAPGTSQDAPFSAPSMEWDATR
jgi:hypothetical protein